VSNNELHNYTAFQTISPTSCVHYIFSAPKPIVIISGRVIQTNNCKKICILFPFMIIIHTLTGSMSIKFWLVFTTESKNDVSWTARQTTDNTPWSCSKSSKCLPLPTLLPNIIKIGLGSNKLHQKQEGGEIFWNTAYSKKWDREWHWHQLGHMQVCTLLHTDNHASTPPLNFLQAGCPSCHPINSVKALKARNQ